MNRILYFYLLLAGLSNYHNAFSSQTVTVQPATNSQSLVELIDAILYSKLDVIKQYLEDGGNPDVKIRNISYTTLLGNSIALGRTDVIKLLLTYGAGVNTPCDEDDNTPLMIAIKKKNSAAMPLLLVAGADLDASNNKQETVMQIAQNYEYATQLKDAVVAAQAIRALALKKVKEMDSTERKQQEEKNNLDDTEKSV